MSFNQQFFVYLSSSNKKNKKKINDFPILKSIPIYFN